MRRRLGGGRLGRWPLGGWLLGGGLWALVACGDLEAGAPRLGGGADGGEPPPPDAAAGDAEPRDATRATDATDAPRTDARLADAAPADATPADATPADATPADAAPPADPCQACPERCVAGRCGREVTNPIVAGDLPDPDVLRLEGPDGPGGPPTYYLSHTVHDAGDLPLFRSRDLVTWERLPRGLFDRPRAPGASFALNQAHFCALWAPDLVEIPGGYLLGFSAVRYATPQGACPPYREDGGVYLAWSPTPEGPFARADHPWEPLPAGAHEASCPLRGALPRSVAFASDDCQDTWCHHIIRLDSDVWRDPATGRWWLAYAWYTNDPPRVDWERAHHGEHVGLVELDAADPFAVRCDAAVPQIHLADPHDADLRAALAASCPDCGEALAFDRGRQGEAMQRAGVPWGVVEGASLFRRGDWVYALMSGSAWDSAFYHVFWVAARSVEGLGQPDRLVGRFLIPSEGMAFGHGAPVLGPDGQTWVYLFHRLDAEACRTRGDCRRDLWVTPIEFIDRGDGHGAVHIAPTRPARTPTVRLPW